MKLPVFEEVKTSDFTVQALIKLFHRHGAGRTPLFIHLPATIESEAFEQAGQIAKALKELGVHPLLPFPFYVISPILSSHPEISVLPYEKDLPRHFYKKTKRLKNKEQSLLNRVRLIADKLTNQDLRDLDQVVGQEMANHRKLYRLTKEMTFYEQVLKDMQK